MTAVDHVADAAHPPAHGKGMAPGIVGVALFIVSEVMFFSGLFGAYFTLRAKSEVWPPEGPEPPGIPYALLLTALLVTSSITVQVAASAAKRGNITLVRRFLVVTVILGLAFLAGQIYEYVQLVDEGFILSTNTFTATFFTITGFHGAHVAGGLIALIVVTTLAMRPTPPANSPIAVEAVSLYWHFVDVVWLFVLTILYVVQ